MKSFILSIILLTSVGCNTALQKELKNAQDELVLAKGTIETLNGQIEPEGKLVHFVFLKTKPDADLVALATEIKKLESIEIVKDLQYGAYQELHDIRALSNYTFVMEMSFDNEADYQLYQKHPIHLALKENTKAFLVGPPDTYDYLKN
jgi:hypothetical protein